jgi:hypothetical protein
MHVELLDKADWMMTVELIFWNIERKIIINKEIKKLELKDSE